MRVEVVTTNLSRSEALSSHVRRRIGFALDHLAHRVRSAVVRLSDTNGPRGGVDKRCCLRVELEPRGTVILSERSADVYAAVDRATGRLKKAVVRGIERRCPRRGRKGSLDRGEQ